MGSVQDPPTARQQSKPPLLETIERVRVAAQDSLTGDPQSHKTLLAEIQALQLAAETPAEKLMRTRFQIYQNLCIRLAVEYGFFQILAAARPEGAPVSAKFLARRSGTEELFVVRLMRLITDLEICEEVSHGVYAANETTRTMAQEGLLGAEMVVTEWALKIGGSISSLARQRKLHQFPVSAHDQKTAFEHIFGQPKWAYLASDPESKAAFDAYMASRRLGAGPKWFEVYDAETELRGEEDGEGGTLIVDVGGGKGHEVSAFRRRFPHVPGRAVLQDLPETLEGLELAREVKVEVMAHDFFQEQPVKGAKIYYLRAVLHDWPDSAAQTILSQIAAAMIPGYSRILLDEYVLPSTKVPFRAAAMDMQMMVLLGGIERTREHWEGLLQSVGLEVVKVWSGEVGMEAVIEARRREG